MRFVATQWLKDHRSVQLLVGWSYFACSKLPSSRDRKLAYLTKSSKILGYLGRQRTLRSAYTSIIDGGKTDFDPKQVNGPRHGAEGLDCVPFDVLTLPTSLVLKAPGANGELGVLYVSFEYNWLKLLRHPSSKAVFEKYLLVGASSWSPTDFGILQSFQGNSPHPAFVGISNRSDMDAYEAAGSGIRALPLMACDWVDPNLFAPKPLGERDIDLLMVAHWAYFKRHDLFFKILRRLPADLRVVLVGRDTAGRTAETMRLLAQRAGCKQNLEIHTRIPNRRVNELQCRARVAIMTTMREGSCVAVTEAFAANTPVAMLRGAHVGSAAHINARTGLLLAMSNAHEELLSMIRNPGQFSPRAWMIENCSAQTSSTKLNSVLRDYCESKGLPWTNDIVALRWVYVPAYVNDADRLRMAPTVTSLKNEFGIELVEYPSEPGLIG